MIYSAMKDYMYDKILGAGSLGEGSTTSLYRKTLELIPHGSRILDVGIGNGTCTIANLDIIQEKELKITGIDIDSDYISAAKQKIMISKGSNNVTADVQDLLTIEGQKWDYVLFSESYPVIDSKLMSLMWRKSFELLNPNGSLLMIHNLCDHPTFIFKYFKKNAKYLTLIDFGKTTSMKDFESHLGDNSLRIKNKKVLFPLSMSNYPEHIRGSFLANMLALITGTSYGNEWRNNNQWFFEIEEIK